MVITKAFFRYLRGELLNGFYIRKLNLVANGLSSMAKLKGELLYWMTVQFNEKTGQNILREEDLKGIAQVAGVLAVNGLTDFLVGWLMLSESHVVEGKERSERGLMHQETGLMEYIRTESDTYTTDISTMATEDFRMSLIPEGEEPVGYVWGDGAAILLSTGKVDEVFLHATPPDGYVYDPVTNKWNWPLDYSVSPPPIYAPWYGDKYMALTSSYFMEVSLPDTMLTYLLQTHQSIKYNGLGLFYLLEATREIIPDLIYDLKFEILDGYSNTLYHSWHHKLTFKRNEYNFSVNNGWVRFSAWGYFISSKFPFIQFNETGE